MASSSFFTRGSRRSTKSRVINPLKTIYDGIGIFITSHFCCDLYSASSRLVYLYLSAIIGCSCLLHQGCAPVFSEMQSARLVQKGGVEATGLYSNVAFAEDGENEHVQNHIGLRVNYGISDNVNLRVGYENIFESGAESAHIIGLGPKISIVQDRIAAFIPIGGAFGQDISTSESWQIHPTALFTLPITEQIEFNPSAKWLIPFDRDQENLVALNFGAGVSTDLNRWVLRPEIGLLYNPGNGGHFTHYSIGFSFYPLFEDDCCPQKLRRNR